MLTINLFGMGQARYLDRSLPGFPHQQPYLLFCHLLLNKTYPQNREQLASLFWGDSTTNVARKSLRNALWRLRQMFQSTGAPPDDYLIITEESVSFVNTSPYWLDVEVFESITQSCQDIPARELAAGQASDLQMAVDIYSGDLLEGIYEDWILYDRERLRISFLSALSKLLVYHGLHGNVERGLACGKRILALDNTREKVHRQMMWLYSLQGDRVAAMAQYKYCTQILREELGVQPMEETRQIYEQIIHNRFDAAHWMMDSKTPTLPVSTPDGSARSMAETALKRLHHLQAIIDETSKELSQLESLVNETISQLSDS